MRTNKQTNKQTRALVIAVSAALMIGGCAAKKEEEGGKADPQTVGVKQEAPLEPVTLKFHQLGTYFTPEDFKMLLADPVHKKYPHITLEMINSQNDMAKMLAMGEQVDFLVTYNGRLAPHKDLNILEDITPLAKKHNFDLTRFDPGALDALKSASDKGELYALPYAVNLNALYYNKDIFDKFGVGYPSDGLTWENAIELGKKVGRQEGGTQYRGLEMDNLARLLFPLSLNVIDPKTDKAMVNSDPYKTAFEIGKSIYSIPGNDYKTGTGAIDRFSKDRNVAMLGSVNLFLTLRQMPDLNWDLAQFPSYKEKPNTYGMYDLHLLIPMKMSQYKDDQMRVMEVMFSDEVQNAMVRKTARISTLKDPKYSQQFAQEISELKGKRIEAVFKSKPAPAMAFSVYYSNAYTLLNAEYEAMLQGKQDTNTALRTAEEKINQLIKTEKGK
ncbi:ABC transporter substrate-binding protein [Paenibacillus ginsengarvi]|nr:extracellular solute-binding protein [Paenibacillus ginsengarvi]